MHCALTGKWRIGCHHCTLVTLPTLPSGKALNKTHLRCVNGSHTQVAAIRSGICNWIHFSWWYGNTKLEKLLMPVLGVISQLSSPQRFSLLTTLNQSLLFSDVKQQRLVVIYHCFRTTCWSPLQGSNAVQRRWDQQVVLKHW